MCCRGDTEAVRSDLDQKIGILGGAAQYDLCGSCFPGEQRRRRPGGGWIYPSVLPDGKRANLLKVLLSNHCAHNCLYCANREGRVGQRERFKAEELSSLFHSLWQKGKVRGLFLSSASDFNPFRTMEEMIKTVILLRSRFRFSGYIHLKILPESPPDYIEAALRWATRVSVNIESPSPQHLRNIAPQKDFSRIWRQFDILRRNREKGLRARAGFTTQLVVGGAGETDREIINTVDRLYREYSMERAYYSAFQPVPGTPLEERKGESTWREHRLYQVDFLLRKYGFDRGELVFDEEGNIPLITDPKRTWALTHPERFPLEVNTASYFELLRVPGIGPVSARRILARRKDEPIRTVEELRRMGIRTKVAAPYLIVCGKRTPLLPVPYLPLASFPRNALMENRHKESI